MRSLIVAAGFAASTTCAQAEAWTCTYILEGFNEPVLHRFQVSPPDLIETKNNDRYRLLQNNGYGLVATEAISAIEVGQQKPTVGASTIIINKGTGEFLWGTIIVGQAAALSKPVQGKCIKD